MIVTGDFWGLYFVEHVRKMSGCCHTQSIEMQTILLAYLIRSNDGWLTYRMAAEFERCALERLYAKEMYCGAIL